MFGTPISNLCGSGCRLQTPNLNLFNFLQSSNTRFHQNLFGSTDKIYLPIMYSLCAKNVQNAVLCTSIRVFHIL
jgi:hypothetical protein